MAKMTPKEQALFDGMRPFAVALAGRGITSEDLMDLDLEELAVHIAKALGRRAELASSRDGNPLPPDDLAFAVELDVFKLLRPWWEKR